MALASSSFASFSSSPRLAPRGRQSLNGSGSFLHFPSTREVRPPKRALVTTKVKNKRAAAEEVDMTVAAPDLASHLFRNRIVYLGMPLNKKVMELMIAQFLHLQSMDTLKPIYFYINSTGVNKNDARLGYETEAYTLYDMMGSIKAPIFTLCVGNAWGEAALLLAAGQIGNRAALPSASIMIKEPFYRFQGPPRVAHIAIEEIKNMKDAMVDLLAEHTVQTKERIEEDIKRPKYFTPQEAIEYGLIDKVLYNEEGQESNGVFSLLKGSKLT
ncbi:hypothetical protein LUZ60_007409 [Juncus effusus]|nr:hypothetical protein LUZ60_007409 [Juncus effusus]